MHLSSVEIYDFQTKAVREICEELQIYINLSLYETSNRNHGRQNMNKSTPN